MILTDPRDLVSREPFSTLFPIRPNTFAAIVQSMRDKGFDVTQPIHVWRQGNVIIDGHTRVKAAIEAGVHVSVCYHDFKDDDEALDYAIDMQRNRRNLTDAELLSLISVVEAAGGMTLPETATRIGTGIQKVHRARAVLADPEEKEHVLSGRKSIGEGYRSVVSKGCAPAQIKREKAEARRNRVKAHFDQNPGVTIYAAAKQLDINKNTLREDLEVLGLKTPAPSRKPKTKPQPKLDVAPIPASPPSPAAARTYYGPTWKRLMDEFDHCVKLINDAGGIDHISRNWGRSNFDLSIRFTERAIARLQQYQDQLTKNLDTLTANHETLIANLELETSDVS